MDLFTYLFVITILILVFVGVAIGVVLKNQNQIFEQLDDLDSQLKILQQDIWKSTTVVKQTIHPSKVHKKTNPKTTNTNV